jgi:hypothetical protein
MLPNLLFFTEETLIRNRYFSIVFFKSPTFEVILYNLNIMPRLTRISGWVAFLSKSRTSLCINIYSLTPVESNSDKSKFRLSRIKVLILRYKKPYYLHSLSNLKGQCNTHMVSFEQGKQYWRVHLNKYHAINWQALLKKLHIHNDEWNRITGETSSHWLWHFYLKAISHVYFTICQIN